MKQTGASCRPSSLLPYGFLNCGLQCGARDLLAALPDRIGALQLFSLLQLKRNIHVFVLEGRVRAAVVAVATFAAHFEGFKFNFLGGEVFIAAGSRTSALVNGVGVYFEGQLDRSVRINCSETGYLIHNLIMFISYSAG